MRIKDKLARSMVLWSRPKDYLYSFRYSDKKTVQQKPFDPKAKKAAEELIEKIKQVCPELDTYLIGSLGFEILGQNDIDLYLIGVPSRRVVNEKKIEAIAGCAGRKSKDQTGWKFEYRGYPAEVILTGHNNRHFKEQLFLFEKIKHNKVLLEAYRALKKSLDGKSQREYTVERMIFFNRIIDGLKKT